MATHSSILTYVAWGDSSRPEEKEGDERGGQPAGKRGHMDLQGAGG